MNILKLCKTITAGTTMAVALFNAPAQAAIDFEPPTSRSSPFLPGTLTSGDFSFASGSGFGIGIVQGDASDWNFPWFGLHIDTQMLVFGSSPIPGASSALTVQRTDVIGGLFSLTRLDVGGWYPQQIINGATLSISGLDQSGTQVAFATTTLSTGALSPFDLSMYSFTNLSSLKMYISAYPGTIQPGTASYAAIDNLVLTPVPEPETYALLLAGLGLLAVIGRRRKTLG
jgi:hypothetical protein